MAKIDWQEVKNILSKLENDKKPWKNRIIWEKYGWTNKLFWLMGVNRGGHIEEIEDKSK